jgi:hypothetical protein
MLGRELDQAIGHALRKPDADGHGRLVWSETRTRQPSRSLVESGAVVQGADSSAKAKNR